MLKMDPKTAQGMLRHEDFATTMELYAQSDQDLACKRTASSWSCSWETRHLLTETVQ